MIRAYLASAGFALLLLVAPLAAKALPGDRFAVAIDPSAVQPLGLGSYAVAITNQPNSSPATQGSIAIPAGFVLDGVVNPPQATIVSGPCAGPSWSVVLSLTSIDLAAPDANSALCDQGTLRVTFAVLVAPLGDGSYEWTTALSGGGGPFTAQNQPTLFIDGTSPETTIQGTPPNPSASRSAAFAFTGSDSGAGIAGFECSLDSAAFGACASQASYGNLSDGSHEFEVRAVDAAGNVDQTPDSYAWTIDATPPPSPVITSAPPNPSDERSSTFLFSDGDPTASLLCEIDGSGFSDCSSGSFPTPVLLDGSHTFRVKARDGAGNESSVEAFTWTIDTVHPLVSVSDAPPLLTNQTSASFSFVANKPGSMYQCALDGAAFAACTSPQLYNGLPNGSHTFTVRAIWLALVGPATSYTWTVDTVPPQTTISSVPPAASRSASATFAFGSSETDSTFACRLDGGGLVPCTSPKTYTGLGDGHHTFSVEAVDRAGNADPSAAGYSWEISGVGPPTQDLTPPRNVRQIKRNVGYGRLQLRWRNPADSDFDHVGVFVSTKRSAPARTLVYKGRGHSYASRRFKNGLYYRYLIVAYDHLENASGGTPAIVPPSALLRSPREGRIVHAPPLLGWTPVRKATFYNVQVFYRGRKILSAWPSKPRRALARRWAYGGHRFSMRRGTYLWYVWPGFGPKSKSRYGQLLGQGTFKLR
jgi:hypothetical protein